MNIIQALDDPKVFGDFFRAGTWDVWRVFLAATMCCDSSPENRGQPTEFNPNRSQLG
jgi:hypothetical protein